MLARLLVKGGASVRVIMTASARDFITPLTMATVSGNPILVENFDPENGAWNSHVKLGEWADLFLIAPATANTLSKMACGIADNLLLCTYLSARCGVMVAPAMDFDMYLHRTTQNNIEQLRALGVTIVEPGEGFLASGLTGKGRMSEPEQIVEAVSEYFTNRATLHGKSVLVTAGGTIERIDPVRYISNFSTGTMGYAIARELERRGAKVTLVSSATHVKLSPTSRIRLIRVESAQEMYYAALENFEQMNLAIFCAAVADYTPVEVAKQKIKHTDERMVIELRPTRDIARELGQRKRTDQRTICFALETNDERVNALKKMQSKHADAVVLNSLEDSGAGFGTTTNKVTIFRSDGTNREYPLKDKDAVARDIVDVACDILE